MPYRFAAAVAILPITFVILSGCKPAEQVTHYRVRRVETPVVAASEEVAPAASPQGKADAMLAAMVPHGARVWFFKLTGSTAGVIGADAAFRGFVESVHFDGDRPLYDPPPDWRAQGPSGLRHETFLIPASDGRSVELAVSSLGRDADDQSFVLPNVNRWRGQMGLAPIGQGELANQTIKFMLPAGLTATVVMLVGKSTAGPMTPATVPPAADTPPAATELEAEPGGANGMLAALVPHGENVWFFKLTGPAEAVAGQREAFRQFVESTRFEADGLRYDPPAAWQAQGRSGMRYETFRIPAAGQPIELAVSSLARPPGDADAYVLANVNRWRDQLGLAPLDNASLAAETSRVELAGGESATLVDLVGKTKTGPPAAPFTGKSDGQ